MLKCATGFSEDVQDSVLGALSQFLQFFPFTNTPPKLLPKKIHSGEVVRFLLETKKKLKPAGEQENKECTDLQRLAAVLC